MTAAPVRGARVHITGIVQGVGFRPFVYGLARQLHLAGWVRNTSAGVDIALDGPEDALQAFLKGLQQDAPPLARIDTISVRAAPPDGFAGFDILPSQPMAAAFQPVSPDVCLCDDCLRELLDPADRRYRYPFINCTNCGPRFSIIRDIPYDRPNTTMAGFALCEACAREYRDPADRRFHAQPVACPACGPHIWLEVAGAILGKREEALTGARRFLKEGWVVAVKGLGGFHLACDATNDAAVDLLRERKLRVDKAFAVMFPDLQAVEAHCRLSAFERDLLTSRERPIVILQRKPGSTLSDALAPGQETIGAMLPYTPLHVLLLERETGFPDAWVMTSGNLSEEPIAIDNHDARIRLDELADAFLLHDRDIHTRCDDSVVRAFAGALYPLRRSRGFAPSPLAFPRMAPPILAVGGAFKNTFCLTRDSYAFMSHHIGDLENYETLQSFRQGIDHFERLFHIKPEVVAYDAHPDYLASQYALERIASEGLEAVSVQHHHAHIAGCMLENNLPMNEPVIGIAFDGTGYGDDGTIWGSEILIADMSSYHRAAHLAPMPMPGGETAIRAPWRLALGLLNIYGITWDLALPSVAYGTEEQRRILNRQLELGINTPITSSMGRLFDAVASLIGVRQQVNYEGQAAIEMEAAADPDEKGTYPFVLEGTALAVAPMVAAIVADFRQGIGVNILAARFHNTVSAMVVSVCMSIRKEEALERVVLSGGVWQNMRLLSTTMRALEQAGFKVFVHHQVPTNDGGLSLGQAAVAASRLLQASGD
ncbi:MAG: carbamoyltransferase HypF [Anaerolineales bacterium]|nr:carbamoyltransferase HypF [Anaerolineales bacterium]